MIKLLRSLIQTPRFHAVLAVFWALMAIPTVLWWSQLILWVLIISLYANVVGHWGAYQAARAEKSEQAGLDNEDLMEEIHTLEKKLDQILNKE